MPVPGEWKRFPKGWCLTGSNAAPEFWTLCSCKSCARGDLQGKAWHWQARRADRADLYSSQWEKAQREPKLHCFYIMLWQKSFCPLGIHSCQVFPGVGCQSLPPASFCSGYVVASNLSSVCQHRGASFLLWTYPQRICPMSQRNSWFIIQCLFQSITLFFISWLPEIPSPILTGHILHLPFLSETIVPRYCAQLNTGQVPLWSWQWEFL